MSAVETPATTAQAEPEARTARQDPFMPLVSYFRLSAGGFHLASVAYEKPSQRSRLIGRLRAALPDWRLVELSLQDPRIDLRERTGYFFEILRQIVEAEAGDEKVDAVLLLDWEQRLAPTDEPVTFMGMFNAGRHILAKKFSCPFAILMPYDEMTTLKRHAPDFASWMSGVFSFPFGPEEIDAGLRAALEAGKPTDRRSAVALVQRLESCLEDWADEPGTNDGLGELRPRALARLGELYLDPLGDARRATEFFERLEHWAASRGPEADEWRERAHSGQKQAAARPAAPEEPRVDPWRIFRGAAALEDEIVGRELDTERVLEMILEPAFRCGVLWGETGCGKSSLVQAGLEKSLARIGFLPVVIDRYEGLEATLCRAVAAVAGLDEPQPTLAQTVAAADAKLGLKADKRQVVLLCDQFERVFNPPISESRAERKPFFESLVACVDDTRLPFSCLFAVRADRLYHLYELDRIVLANPPLAPENMYELRWLHSTDAVRVFDRLAAASAAAWAPELVGRVVDDLAIDDRVRPVEIQLVAAALFLRSIETVAAYEEAGGCEGLFKEYCDAVLDDLSEPMKGRLVLRALVFSESPPVRATRTVAEIAEVTRRKERVINAVLKDLATRHLVQAIGEREPRQWELVHDVLCEPAWKAASPQEIGASVLRRAVRERRWWLKLRELSWALRSETGGLPEQQRSAARRLLRRTLAALGAKGMLCLLLLVAAIQFSFAHVHIETEDPQAVRVYRGLRALDFLPAPLGHSPWFDTGLTDRDVPANQRNQLFELRLLRWDSARSQRVARFQSHLDTVTGAQRLAYLGAWEDAVRILLEEIGRSRTSMEIYAFTGLPGWSGGLLGDLGALELDKLIEQFLPFLEDSNTEFRRTAATALGKVGDEHAEIVVKSLLPLLNDPESDVRRVAAEALGQIGGEQTEMITDKLLSLLKDPDSSVRGAAAEALGQIGGEHAETVTDKLLLLLKDPDIFVRRAAADALRWFGREQPKTVVDKVLPLLNDPDSNVRKEAARALWQIDGEQETVVDRFLPLLSDPESEVRWAATMALWLLEGERTKAEVDKLLPLLNDPFSDVRWAAAKALGQIGGVQTKKVVGKLLPLLNDPDSDVREAAAEALGQIGGEQAEAVVDKLFSLLNDPDSDVYNAAAEALGQIGGEQAEAVVDKLLSLLKDPDSEVPFRVVVETLRQVGGEQPDTLFPLLSDPDSKVRRAAVEALLQIGGEQSEVVVERLLPLLNDPDSEVRWAAADELGQIGGEQVEAALDTLLPLLNDPDSKVRERVADILMKVADSQPLPLSTLPQIAVHRNDPGWLFRKKILHILVLHEYQIARNDTASLHEHFLAELESRPARLDARYREAVVHALARWYNAGLLAEESDDEPLDLKALAEHEAFQKELDRLRNLERSWWLRIAACEVLVEAYRLRTSGH